jgi:hypothetical protein
VEEDPAEAIQRILDSGRRVRLGRGVVSKTAYIAFAVVTVWGIIAWKLFWYIRGTHDFAEKNPAQAMLEGAELLEWQKMGLKAKGSRAIQPTNLTAGVVDPARIEAKR